VPSVTPDLSGLEPEVVAAARLIGALKPDVPEPDPSFLEEPLATLEGLPGRLDQLVALLDALVEPDTAILPGTRWYPLAGSAAHAVVTDASGFGVGLRVTTESGSIDGFAYLPLAAFGAGAAHVVAGSEPMQIRVRDAALGSIDTTIPLDGSAPSGVLTLTSGQTFRTLSDALDARAVIDAALAQQPPLLDKLPTGSASTVGQILVAAGVLQGVAQPYALSGSLGPPATSVALAVLHATLAAVAGDTPIVKLDGGGVFVDASAGYGLRVAGEAAIGRPRGPKVRLSLGSVLTGDSAAAGIHVGVLDAGGRPAPSLALTSVGANLAGAGGKPLVAAAGWTIGAVELRGSFDASSKAWAVAGQVDAIGTPLAGSLDKAGGKSGNGVAKSLVAAGPDQTTGGPASPVNPAFSARIAYSPAGGFSFQALDDKGKPSDTVWIPVQRRFGPVTCKKIGVEARGAAGDPEVGIALDGGVKLGSLDIELSDLSVAAPLRQLGSVDAYDLDLQGLAVSYASGGVALSGGLVKNDTGKGITYDGEALLQAEGYALSAVGSYASLPDDGSTSLFVFAWLNAPIGGPAFFYVTGLAAGFGYNRSLRIPGQDEVATFPLVAGVSNPAAVGGDSSQPAKAPGPGAVLDSLSSWAPLARGELWFAAGVQFTSFEVVKSNALLVVEAGQDLVVALLGTATLQQPIDGPTWVWAQLDLEVVFRERAGELRAAAVLNPGSYVLTGDAHLEGGFGFATWFGDNPHAGDFVLTLGGYHPAFAAPPWYPQEPRIGIDWQVSDDIAVVGNAYFAMTPAAMMAGAEIQATLDAGPLKAWLKADVDTILFWHPFYVDASLSISIGVSFHLHVAFVDVTLSVEIGVDFDVYGPAMGFDAHVDWYIVSFSIHGGADPGGPQPIGWDQFKGLLPVKEQATKVPAYVTIAAKGGLVRSSVASGASHWLMRSHRLRLAVESVFPPAADPSPAVQKPAISGPNGTTLEQDASIAVRPVALASADYRAPVTIEILEATAKGPIASTADWVLAPARKPVPKALWGPPVEGASPPADAAAPTIDAVAGATLGVKQDLPAECTPEMKIATVFADQTRSTGVLPIAPSDEPVGASPVTSDTTFGDLGSIDLDPALAARAALFTALAELGVAAWYDDPLTAMAASPGDSFADEPMEGAPA
jgi:hypothetical protein